jgi:hypothetical protein
MTPLLSKYVGSFNREHLRFKLQISLDMFIFPAAPDDDDDDGGGDDDDDDDDDGGGGGSDGGCDDDDNGVITAQNGSM